MTGNTSEPLESMRKEDYMTGNDIIPNDDILEPLDNMRKEYYLTSSNGETFSHDDFLAALLEVDDDIAKYQQEKAAIRKKIIKCEKKMIDLKYQQEKVEDRLRYLRSVKTTVRLLLSKS